MLAAPTLGELPLEVTVLAGAPLHLPLDGFDSDGDTLSYTAEITGNNDLETFIPEGNRNLRISVESFGDMLFELFEGRAPDVTARIVELAESDFYDGLTFHRILDDFMIQGGDPAGDGSGGSGVEFDDQFHPDLQHTSSGLLSMAKGFDDSNDSQVFITDVPTRHLDFNHSIFGILTEGDAVREAIQAVPANHNSGLPDTPVVISQIAVEPGGENGVLMLSAPEGTTGVADVTVTVDDGTGGTAQRAVHVVILPDTENTSPYLPVAPDDLHATGGETVNFTIPTAVDVDQAANGDELWYGAWPRDDWGFVMNNELDVNVDAATGEGTVRALNGLAGVHGILVGVNPLGLDFWNYLNKDPVADPRYVQSVSYMAGWDFQIVPLVITPGAAEAVELLSDTGSNTNDLRTNLNNATPEDALEFRITGVADGADVILFAGGVEIGRATASGHTVEITTDGTFELADGEHDLTVRQEMLDQPMDVGNNGSGTVDLVGDVSGVMLTITVDTTAPVFEVTGIPPAADGELFTHDVQTDAEAGDGATYGLVDPPSGVRIDPATGVITWTPVPGQSPSQTITIEVVNLAGNTSQQQIEVQVTPGGPIDQVEFPNHSAVDGDVIALRPMRRGWLTIEANFDHNQGHVNLELYDASGTRIGGAYGPVGYERIDRVVDPGETYELRIIGDNPNVSYRVTNLVADTYDTLAFYGTDGDDTFEIFTGFFHDAVINGVEYSGIDPSVLQVIRFDGLEGDDTATIVGSQTPDVVMLKPGGGHVIGGEYEIDLLGTATITIDGGGGADIAYLSDSPGDDTFSGTPTVAEFSGPGFEHRLDGFTSVEVTGSDGFDVAKLFDSRGDDRFTAMPTFSLLQGETFRLQAAGFDQVHGYGGGGTDVARLFDSPGDDTFQADPEQGALYGADFYVRARGFEGVHAYAVAGGNDTAVLDDSPQPDTFVANPTYGALYGDGYYNRAKLFESVLARATASTGDVARFHDSVGDETFLATPTSAAMAGAAFNNQARHFDTVEGRATAGGDDTAKLFDSPGDDQLVASPEQARLSGATFDSLAVGFDEVHAYASAGGNDTAELSGSAGDDTFDASPTQASLAGTEYYVRAKEFDEVEAVAGAGGNDRATLHDSAGNDNFVGTPGTARLHGADFDNLARGFATVKSYADGGGSDVAKLFDSAGNDVFVGTPTAGQLTGPGFEHQTYYFDQVHAFADVGGDDLAKLFDSAGDDTFDVDATIGQGALHGAAFYNRAKLFEEVHAYSNVGGRDEAVLNDSPGDDTFTADPNQSVLSGDGFYYRARQFEEVYAEAAAGGFDEGVFSDSGLIDQLVAEDEWARISNATLDFLFEAESFDRVTATATTAGDTADVGTLSDGFDLVLTGTWQNA